MTAGARTERLYYTDAYLPEFRARVVERADDGRRVYLDRTAFYPTSGGQPHDVGTLGGAPVVDVIDEDDRIAHVLSAPAAVDVGAEVPASIDWTRRFDNMQQHTGQHLLSAVLEDLFGAKTVSVHFGDAYSTVDLEIDSMPPRSLENAERRANLVVAENRPVSVTFEDAAAAKGLRKAVDRAGELRIITIADLDRSACGGTHVKSTGEIGAILVRGSERTKKAIRVEFVCGLRAVARARADHQALTAIAATLSTSIDAVAPLVAAQAAQLKESEKTTRGLEKTLAGYRARALYDAAVPRTDGVRLVEAISEGLPMDTLRALGMALMEWPKSAFVGCSPEGQLLVTTSEDSARDAGAVLRETLARLGGKGGGSPRLAQGSAPGDKAAEAARLILDALGRGR